MRFGLWGCEFVFDFRDLGVLNVFVMWGFVNFDEWLDFVCFWCGDVGMCVCVCDAVGLDLMI